MTEQERKEYAAIAEKWRREGRIGSPETIIAKRAPRTGAVKKLLAEAATRLGISYNAARHRYYRNVLTTDE